MREEIKQRLDEMRRRVDQLEVYLDENPMPADGGKTIAKWIKADIKPVLSSFEKSSDYLLLAYWNKDSLPSYLNVGVGYWDNEPEHPDDYGWHVFGENYNTFVVRYYAPLPETPKE